MCQQKLMFFIMKLFLYWIMYLAPILPVQKLRFGTLPIVVWHATTQTWEHFLSHCDQFVIDIGHWQSTLKNDSKKQKSHPFYVNWCSLWTSQADGIPWILILVIMQHSAYFMAIYDQMFVNIELACMTAWARVLKCELGTLLQAEVLPVTHTKSTYGVVGSKWPDVVDLQTLYITFANWHM